jgi:exopolysaccharide biosynthesis polyprenyl glycosylphosphotransferase
MVFALGALLVGVCVGIVLIYCEAYGSEVLSSFARSLHSITLAIGLVAIAFAFAAVIAIYTDVRPPKTLVATTALAAAFYVPLLLLERSAFRFVCSRVGERVIIVGASELGGTIASFIRERPNLGIELTGFLSDTESLQGEQLEGFPILGRVSELEKIVDAHEIDRIVVASKDRAEAFPAEQLLAFKLRGVPVDSALDLYERTGGRIYLKDLRTSYLIFSDGFHQGPLASVMKRALDVVVAIPALLLASPVLALAGVAIRLDTPGPAIFRQERVGLDGKTFRITKLRTMEHGAEEAQGVAFADEEDPRITRVGRVLRKIRLDEVPQFWDVLRGVMSLVGPRPERPEWIETLTARHPFFRWRSTVKPGLTGWAQIRYGYVNDLDDFERKLELDLFYMKHRSLAFDLLVLWETVKTVVLMRGL